METPCSSNESQVSLFKQEVFSKLALLGMPHGNAASVRHLWKFVNLSSKLGTDTDADPSQCDKLVRALSRELGASHAQLFIQWLADQIKVQFSKELKVPIPTVPACVVVGDAECSQQTQLHINKVAESAIAVEALSESKAAHNEAKLASGGPMVCTKVSAVIIGASSNQVLESQPTVTAEDLPSTSPEVEDEAWVQVKSGEGKIYYWDRRTNACAWKLPEGFKPKWRSYKSSDGRTYYADCSGKVFWVMPPLKKGPAAKAEGKPAEPTSAPPTLYLPDIGDVMPVSLPIAANAAAGDLGPFESVFPTHEVEAVKPPCPTVSTAAAQPQEDEEPETPVLAMRQVSALRSAEVKKAALAETHSTTASKENVPNNINCPPRTGGMEKIETPQSHDDIKDSVSGVSSLREELAQLRMKLALLSEEPSSFEETRERSLSPEKAIVREGSRSRTRKSLDRLNKKQRTASPDKSTAQVSAAALMEEKPLQRKRKGRISKGSSTEKPLRRKRAANSSRTIAEDWEVWSQGQSSATKSEEQGHQESPISKKVVVSKKGEAEDEHLQSPASKKLSAIMALAQKAAKEGPDFWKASHTTSAPGTPQSRPKHKCGSDSDAESQDSAKMELSDLEDNASPRSQSPSQDDASPRARSLSHGNASSRPRSPSQNNASSRAPSPSQDNASTQAQSPSQDSASPQARSPSQDNASPRARSPSQDSASPRARSPSQDNASPRARSPSQASVASPRTRSQSQDSVASAAPQARSQSVASPRARSQSQNSAAMATPRARSQSVATELSVRQDNTPAPERSGSHEGPSPSSRAHSHSKSRSRSRSSCKRSSSHRSRTQSRKRPSSRSPSCKRSPSLTIRTAKLVLTKAPPSRCSRSNSPCGRSCSHGSRAHSQPAGSCSPAARSRSRSPSRQVDNDCAEGSPGSQVLDKFLTSVMEDKLVNTDCAEGSPGSQVLDKFLTSVMEDKPPGNWRDTTAKSALDFDGKHTTCMLRPRSSLGGA